MTYGAVRRKSCSYVVWIRSLIELGDMTRRAGSWGPGELAVYVATRAWNSYVRSGQWKLCECIVIEGGRRPGRRRMACLAGRGEHCCDVIGILGCRVILHVTIRAIRARAAEIPADVTVGALKLRVSTGQWELRKVVIEGCGLPGRSGMA